LQEIFGWVFSPLAWTMGVPWDEARTFGNLLGTKIAINEFVAYIDLVRANQSGALSPRSVVIGTYALCGFANFSSLAIQIGGIGAMAPGRRADLARLGLKAMLGGAFASWLTACIAGLLTPV
jgi:CNT family concentrative nucleoside transporter